MIVTLVKHKARVPAPPAREQQAYWGTLVFVPKRTVAEADQMAFEDRCFAVLPNMVPPDAELSWGWMDSEHFLVDVFSDSFGVSH